MKRRYDDGGEIDAMEAADKAYRANKRPLKEMGDASAAEEAGQFGDAGSSRTVKATPKKAAPKPTAKAKPKLIDPSNIRSGPRFDDEGLIDPSNIRSGRREFEESLIKKPAKGMKNGGSVKKMSSGGSASRRADGIAVKGKTRGRMC